MFDINNYYEAYTLHEAFNILNSSISNIKIIAGGSDVLIKSRSRKPSYTDIYLLGITRIKELNEIKLLDNGDLYIGACNTFTTIENNELVNNLTKTIAYACGTVGGPQIRNVGTIGGNIANGAPSADTSTILLAYDAVLGINNGTTIKEMNINDFYIGPSKVRLEKNELLQYILIKKENYENYKGAYIKFAQRNAMDIATLGCSVLLKAENNIIDNLKIAFSVSAPTPIRATSAESFAKGLELTVDNINNIGIKCLDDSKTRDSFRASKAYRDQLITVLFSRAVEQILAKN